MSNWAMLPKGVPLGTQLHFSVAQGLHRSDLDNLTKAILDAAQGAVFHNDCWIDVIRASRGSYSEDSTVAIFYELES